MPDASAPVMADLLLVVVTTAFFGLSWAYVRACDRL
jgi:hypothetical protein